MPATGSGRSRTTALRSDTRGCERLLPLRLRQIGSFVKDLGDLMFSLIPLGFSTADEARLTFLQKRLNSFVVVMALVHAAAQLFDALKGV